MFDCSHDEAMHSGVDVEAFQAALNRDIGGDVSTSQFFGSNACLNFIHYLVFNINLSLILVIFDFVVDEC